MSAAESTAPQAQAPPSPNIWRIYRAVVGVGLLCGVAIVVVYELTRPIIQRNQLEFREEAIKSVLPGALETQAFRMNDAGQFEAAPSDARGGDLVFAGYDENRALVGLALEAQGMGYQDVLRMLYGYSFEHQSILGIRVLESRETPGLGDRIETDPKFLENFGSLDVSVSADGTAIAHPIEFVKPGEKNAAWQIDGISGATITSEATALMLRESSGRWIPQVRSRREDFKYKQRAE